MFILGARKEVYEAEAYVSGKSMDDVKKEFNLTKVIKLGSNENPYAPFPNALKAMEDQLSMIGIYPEANFIKLRGILGKKFGLSSEYIGLGHGAGGVLETIARLFIESGDEAIVPTQTYRLYREITKLMGGIVREVSLDKNYTISIDDIIKNINPKTKLVWLCNPNNPTGTIIKKEGIDRILDALPETGWIILDEAYAEFSNKDELPNIVDYIKKDKHVISVKTFSKYYGLAGARLGYIISNPQVINGFDTVSEPFNANRIALAGGIECLTSDTPHVERAANLLINERERVSRELEKLNLKVTKPYGNFIFFEVPCDGDNLGLYMLKKGVIVRPCSGWGYKNHIRVTIGTKEEMDEFLKVIKDGLSVAAN
ncbi:histidinol-phosphate transaminase [Clostridium fermenticellae]|uniref:Histidinol-phosphate aminotransferase n=1 Tax=Clostridium fermenticellae TaxID=2068654 RepID=A0A386H3S9_9CLOT|nr:histidinol-phosphate transaminase [Clostridium fermenticellae]AYD40391.1 histidinol-phosphate transaminase [Clostridium fermenticellae]